MPFAIQLLLLLVVVLVLHVVVVIQLLPSTQKFWKNYFSTVFVVIWLVVIGFAVGMDRGQEVGAREALEGKYQYKVEVDSTLVRLSD